MLVLKNSKTRSSQHNSRSRKSRTKKARILARLIKESQVLDQRFLRINKGFLYEKAPLEDAAARTKKLRKLYDILTRAGRKSAQAPIL